MSTDGWSGPLLGERFEVGELLGVGGSAAVFVALDRLTGERVAVKIGHAHVGAELRSDVAREAEVAERLDHPNVARVHAHGWHDSAGLVQPWLAMDLVPGPSLAAWVAEHGALSPRAAATAIAQVLDALGAAHAIGLVHRDVAPDNVLLDAEGRLRLVDFGLASAFGAAGIHAGSGKVVGHVHYMSPEQARGQPAGPAGDLYQAGALLHFLLTGEPPFVRDRVEDVLRAHVEAPVPVPSARDPRNRPLDTVVATALAKSPERRFASAVAMRDAVARLLGADDVPADAAATQAVAAAGRTTTVAAWTPAANATAAGPTYDEDFRESRFGGIGWLLGAALVLIVAMVWGLAGGDSTTALATSTPTPSATPTPEPVVTTPVAAVDEPVDDSVAVPVLVGSLPEIESRLRAAGLTVGAVRRVSSPEVSGTVLGGSSASGTRVPPGSAVDLDVASGSNVVPSVAGTSVGEARALLEAAGFVPVVVESTSASVTGTSVVGTQPGSGTVLRLGVSVTVEVVGPPAQEVPDAPAA
ncbi:protein kinase [Aeromicrobium sp. Leaf350]|uniref:protein kinase domain-containing protein n=1 Tax=Aeromicrobium sp. Leaf350 TaxID=2876565 RepID=UPI001E4EB79E|nr:protein kinase [Aeromicrobium sp. Leaf350]